MMNSIFNLGEQILDAKIVRKVRRSIHKRFRLKDTAVKENKDLNKIKIDELVGSLQTYKLSLPQSIKKKNTVKEETSDQDDDHTLKNEVHLTRKFKKFLRHNKKLLDKYKHYSSKNKNKKRRVILEMPRRGLIL